jgi:hypothetical protein
VKREVDAVWAFTPNSLTRNADTIERPRSVSIRRGLQRAASAAGHFILAVGQPLPVHPAKQTFSVSVGCPKSVGFSHFVASMTAPIASGWSGCRVGFAPTGKRRLVTAHTRSGLPGMSPPLLGETRSEILGVSLSVKRSH